MPYEFKDFVSKNGVKHVLTVPGHPSTNGYADIFVKVLKKSVYETLGELPNEEQRQL